MYILSHVIFFLNQCLKLLFFLSTPPPHACVFENGIFVVFRGEGRSIKFFLDLNINRYFKPMNRNNLSREEKIPHTWDQNFNKKNGIQEITDFLFYNNKSDLFFFFFKIGIFVRSLNTNSNYAFIIFPL